MRLLFPVVVLSLTFPTVSAAQTSVPAVPVRQMPVINPDSNALANCPATSRYEAAKRGGKLGAQKLNQLPMADGYKAVLRHIDRCPAPIIVGYGFGATQK